MSTLLLGTACIVVAVTWALTAAAKRREPGEYLEDALERELNRHVRSSINRLIAVEAVVMMSALRYLFGGFREPLPSGYSYVRSWTSLPLLIAIPVLTIPEMLVLDFALWNVAPWRAVSDVLHVYSILWCAGIAATARLRPHRCDADRVRLRFGCIRRLDVSRANIANVALRGTIADPKALAREPGTLSMIRSGVPTVEVTLHAPIVVRSFRGAREVRRVLVAADEPRAFGAALMAS